MRHRAFLPALLVFATLRASTSFACLNDTSASVAEDEFRSRYNSAAADSPSPADKIITNSINPWGLAGLAIGSGLIAGSSIVGFRRRKRPEV